MQMVQDGVPIQPKARESVMTFALRPTPTQRLSLPSALFRVEGPRDFECSRRVLRKSPESQTPHCFAPKVNLSRNRVLSAPRRLLGLHFRLPF